MQDGCLPCQFLALLSSALCFLLLWLQTLTFWLTKKQCNGQVALLLNFALSVVQ